MTRTKAFLVLVAAIVAAGAMADQAQAFNRMRKRMGGHPYHNGYYFIPPSSAYEWVRVRPPIRYGAPAYYFPESYLGPSAFEGGMPAAWYPGIPVDRLGGYYMSEAGPAFFYPHHRPVAFPAR
jgi:hypothetical protein